MSDKKKVFVGLSGGVDSSVAAWRLKEQGYDVTGVFIKVWHPDFLVCNWEQERLDAMRVAAHLDIPFLTCDAEAEYRDEVAKYFIGEYTVGRTPNPDVMCNKYVKFGAFLKFAKTHQADFIATGHYARRIDGDNGPELHRGVDENKDQTYFLWTLSNEQLKNVLFPVGDTTKEDIRHEADKAGLPTATKKDSQGVCFLGYIDIPEFISHFVDLQAGDVLDEKGEVVGCHKGAIVYTLGQRHGFTIDTIDGHREAYYVVDRDTENNTITVSSQRPKVKSSDELVLKDVVARGEVEVGDELEAQTRYRQKPFAVRVEKVTNTELVLSIKDKSVDAAASGQSCVLYRGSLCVLGGIIA
ncbi:MAG: tRNA 2-thiouridine(34) synthase MnmA [Candidatus Nomurabacteria bacterium]|nr:tRNA 2-thiouridine(34) synthase MnmA [Candidatus Nomurabacteria bacterium]USN87943.1 MAG: tRNA 2-thiouridine(34) synthase MnmA [Candidatus Nomurabacteria bacterium]